MNYLLTYMLLDNLLLKDCLERAEHSILYRAECRRGLPRRVSATGPASGWVTFLLYEELEGNVVDCYEVDGGNYVDGDVADAIVDHLAVDHSDRDGLAVSACDND